MPAPEKHDLKPPASVMKIAGFLGEIQKHHELGAKVDVGDIWDRHDISVSHISDFVDWLHVDRKEAVPPEMTLSQEPEKSLAKKNDVDEVGSEGSRDRPLEVLPDEPDINIHLWKAIFKSEAKRARREMPQSRLQASAGRAQNFAKNYNGGLLLANLHLTQQTVADAAKEQESPERAAPQYLTNGLAAQAFGNEVVDRGSPMPPVWNEPVRKDLMPELAVQRNRPAESPAEAPPRSGPDWGKIGAIGAMGALSQMGLQNQLDPRSVVGGMGVEASPERVADMLYGQITLVAPPLQVSPDVGQGATVGLSFDWKDMAKGAGPVDYQTLQTVAKSLPEGSRVLYPAIHPRQLTGGAVNLKLEPRFAESLASQGYGPQAKVDGRKSAQMAVDYEGGTPPIRLLPATLTPLLPLNPLNRQRRAQAGLAGDNLPQDNFNLASEEPQRRMRFIDFFGLPIYLSPHLNTSPDLDQQVKASISTEFMPRAPLISPVTFAGIRSGMLGGFYGVEAKPDVGAWRGATPDYARAGSLLAGLLSTRGPIAGGVGATGPVAGMVGSASRVPFSPISPKFAPTSLSRPSISAIGGGSRSSAPISNFAPGPMPSLGSPPSSSPAPSASPSVPTVASAPIGFRPSIPTPPSMPGETAGSGGQSATAPQGPGASPMMRVSPSITVAPEKPTSSPPSLPATQSMPSASPASPSMPEATMPSMPTPSAMTPQSQMPRPVSQPKKASTPSTVLPPKAPDPSGMQSGSSLKPPQMLIAPPKPVSGPKSDSDALAVQTSTTSPGATPSDAGGTRSMETAQKQDSALPGSEVNLLANEVWILLKRKLAFEAQRAGR